MTFPPVTYAPEGIDRESSGVRAIGVMGVIFSVIALCMLPFTIGQFTTYGWPIEGAKTAPIELWLLFSTIFGLGLAALLLVSSLGCYRFQSWGRGGMILWSIASLLYGAAGVYFFGRWLVPAWRGEFARSPAVSPFAPLCCWAVGTLFAMFVLWYLLKPTVRNVFSRAYMD